MSGPSEDFLDKVFFFVALLLMVFVATNPNAFIKTITFGRSSAADVSHGFMRLTQIVAGIAAVSIAVWLTVTILTKTK